MWENSPNRCEFVSERSNIRCQLHKNHVEPGKSMWGTDHRAWDENDIPIMKVSN
jgi:hypothetical protein